MNFKRTLAGGLLGASLVMLLSARASAQQTYLLTEKTTVGDVSQCSQSYALTLVMRDTAKPMPALKMGETRQQKYRTEVLAVDGAGHPSDVRVVYSAYVTDLHGPKGDKIKANALQGKTERVRLVKGDVLVQGENGVVDEASRQDLVTAMDPNLYLYPDHPIAIGAEWSPDKAGVERIFMGVKNVSIRGKFADIVPFGGYKCAHVHWKMSADMPAQGIDLKIKWEGDSYEALDIHRTLSLVLAGPTAMNDKQDTMSATGTSGMNVVSKWVKIAGKPVSAQR